MNALIKLVKFIINNSVINKKGGFDANFEIHILDSEMDDLKNAVKIISNMDTDTPRRKSPKNPWDIMPDMEENKLNFDNVSIKKNRKHTPEQLKKMRLKNLEKARAAREANIKKNVKVIKNPKLKYKIVNRINGIKAETNYNNKNILFGFDKGKFFAIIPEENNYPVKMYNNKLFLQLKYISNKLIKKNVKVIKNPVNLWKFYLDGLIEFEKKIKWMPEREEINRIIKKHDKNIKIKSINYPGKTVTMSY